MSTQDVAQELVRLCQHGQFSEAIEKFYAQDIVSVEPMGDPAESVGLPAVLAKTQWWVENHEMHGAEVEGPYVNGDQFVVRFKMDVTPKATGERMTADEMGVYTVKDGQIVHERFFM